MTIHLHAYPLAWYWPTMESPTRLISPRASPIKADQQSLRRIRVSEETTSTRALYVIAHPAPVFSDKAHFIKHLRPKLHLQLQLYSSNERRYEPIIDVMSQVPATGPKWMVSKLRTCVKRLTGHKQYPHCDKPDVFLLESSEPSKTRTFKHNGVWKTASGLEDLAESKVVSVLQSDDSIVTENGQIWTTSIKAKGAFEFTSVNSYGVKSVARWVPTKSRRTKSSMASTLPLSPLLGETTFLFSLIDPSTRRHAVLATLTPSSLVIKETYQEPKSTPSSSENEEIQAREMDRTTKTLILATSVWLDLRLGWSPTY